MNRILFEASEARDDRLTLRGARAEHIRRVLRAVPGDVLRLGELNGPFAEGVLEDSPSAEEVTLRLRRGETPPKPPLDLLLALPRPKVLHRLLPQIAALGVGRIFLCNAARVERCYFDTHVLEDAQIRAALIEGLTQAGDTHLPEWRVVQRLKPFVEDELPALTGGQDRWILHPAAPSPLQRAEARSPRILLAIGPEGGWVPHELTLFSGCGFQPFSLGSRVLRSDTATLLALGLAQTRFTFGAM